MATRKPWEAHSERWKRKAAREGLSPRRWNAWAKLSPKSRAQTDPRKYAQGQSVGQQTIEKKRAIAVAAIMSAKSGVAREFTVRRGVQAMPTAELTKLGKLSAGQLDEYITRKARQPMPTGQRNPYWYR